jgi:hypothetical protein
MALVKRKMPVGTKLKKGSAPTPILSGDLTLPTTRSVPSNRLQDYTILLFGEKKIGKTDLTAQFPDTFHLMTEPGGKAQSIFQRAVPDWRTFQGYVKLLEKDKTFRTVTVDTADLLYGYCFEYVMQKEGMDHPSEGAYGKGWDAIKKEFTTWVLRLMAINKGVIFISHAAEKEVKMRGGETYDRIQPSLANQARNVLEGIVDLWFYYGYDGKRRILTIQGNDHIGAGHRLKNNFKYADGSPVTEIDMGDSAEAGYANLLAAFTNKYVAPRKKEEVSGTTVKKLKFKR